MELEIKKRLEHIYLDYYDGLYNEQQLKMLLMRLYKQLNMSDSKWSELILDAQWKHASEEDYEIKRRQLDEENKEDGD
jgi:hypothetical protein